MYGVCEGLTVLDFTFGMAGSLATMVLADNGAEVIKIEPPSGDPYRRLPTFIMWNRGKKSVVLDLKTPVDREKAQALGRRADVIVESFRPGVTDRLGIGYETLSAHLLFHHRVRPQHRLQPPQGIRGYRCGEDRPHDGI